MKKISLIFYFAAIILILIPIMIVLVTGNGFGTYSSQLIINIATLFVIEGLLFSAVRKAKDEGVTPWTTLGAINGILIILLWNFINQ